MLFCVFFLKLGQPFLPPMRELLFLFFDELSLKKVWEAGDCD